MINIKIKTVSRLSTSISALSGTVCVRLKSCDLLDKKLDHDITNEKEKQQKRGEAVEQNKFGSASGLFRELSFRWFITMTPIID